MSVLQDPISLQPGETLRAMILQDRQVQLLRDGFLVTLGVMLAVTLTILLDTSLDRALSGPGSGLLMTFLFLFGPLLLQRVLGARPAYVLTDRRLILAEDDTIELHQIRRIRVWLTSISLQTDTRRVWLQNLTNAAAVARLIRDTMTR
ncbi:MAG: hypothetical protein ACK4NW_01010 [Roseinatronobacter sp.]